MKKRQSLFLAFAFMLAFALLPMVKTQAAGKTYTATENYVNPIYKDIIQVSDLKQPRTTGMNSAALLLDDDYYYDNLQDAGEYMRSQLKNWEESIVIQYQAEDYSSEIVHGISDVAFVHTGDPKEGDYLLYQYDGWRTRTSYYYSDNTCYMTITYTVTYYTSKAQEAEMDQAVERLKNTLHLDGKNDYEVVKGIYDYICDHVTYDYDNLDDDDYVLKYTAYAALVNRTAVCQGYAVLFYRLALTYGVDTRVISGFGNGEAHGWNIVQLNDRYYNLDSTWDAGTYSYRYFLRCPSNFPGHVRDAEYDDSSFHGQYPMSSKDFDPSEPMLTNIAKKCTFTLSQSTYTYSGAAKKPSVYVKLNGVKLTKNQDFTLTYADNVEVGMATVTVTGRGNYTGSKTLSFMVRPTGTPLRKVENASGRNLSIEWEKNDAVDGYEVKYSTQSNFADARTQAMEGCDQTEMTLTNRTIGKRYYCRVRTYKVVNGEKLYSLWSEYKSSYVVPPVDFNSVVNEKAGTITASWTASNYAIDGYDLVLASDEAFSKIARKEELDPSKTSLEIDKRTKGKSYYIRIRSFVLDAEGNKIYSSWSPTSIITIQQ